MQRPNQTPAQRQEQRQELWQPQHQEQSHARHREQRSPLKRTAIGRCARAGLVALAGVAGLVASGLAGVVAEVRVAAADPPVVWEVTEGIKAPESAYWDAEAGVLFLSQIGGGGGTAKDGDGWISKLSREGKVTPVTPEPLGNLDGVERDGAGGYVVTDWRAGKVFHVSKSGEAKLVLALPQGAADHAVLLDTKTLVLPRMLENRVTAYDLRAILPK